MFDRTYLLEMNSNVKKTDYNNYLYLLTVKVGRCVRTHGMCIAGLFSRLYPRALAYLPAICELPLLTSIVMIFLAKPHDTPEARYGPIACNCPSSASFNFLTIAVFKSSTAECPFAISGVVSVMIATRLSGEQIYI